MKMSRWKHFTWIAVGGIAGFGWYYFVGCATGTCPISSNPYISTGYGALIAALASTARSGPGQAKKAD
jgi:hypothetical protein